MRNVCLPFTLFMALVLGFLTPVFADQVSDPVVNPTSQTFTATFQASVTGIPAEALRAIWTLNDGAGGTYPVNLPATATSATRAFEVRNDDVVCFEILAEASGNTSGAWRECVTVSGLPGAPNIPENVTLSYGE